MPLAAANRCPKSTGRRYFFAARSDASPRGPILKGEREEQHPVARCMPAPDRCRAAKKMKAAFPQFRARGLNGGKPRSALLGRPLSASRHRNGAPASFLLLAPRGSPAEAGRPRDRRIPLRVLPPACRGPARGRRDFRGERERTRDGQKASAGDGGPFCQTFGFRKGLGSRRKLAPVGSNPTSIRSAAGKIRRKLAAGHGA